MMLLVLIALAGCSKGAQDPDITTSQPTLMLPTADFTDDETLLQLAAEITKNPQDDVAYRRRGDEFYRRGDYELAAGFLQQLGWEVV